MTRSEMEHVLSSILEPEQAPLDPPTAADWASLSVRLSCSFDADFCNFIELLSSYQFPGDIYNVSTGNTNGNDSIQIVYDTEMSLGHWNPNMVPFYGIGNGDYFCLNRLECPNSKVYYYYADRDAYEAYSPSFEHWVRNLPTFLA